jgi:hypothetical protein
MEERAAHGPQNRRGVMGSLYQRENVWWLKYYANGCPVRESTGTAKAKAARDFLKDREGRVAIGQPVLPRASRVTCDELAKDLRTHYETTGDRNTVEAETRLAHLDRFFTGRRAAAIDGPLMSAYLQGRQAMGASNATINRETSLLVRMLRSGFKNNKVMRLPMFDKLKEAAPRQGFFEREQYEAVRRHLAPDLQVAAAIAHT